MPSPVGHALGGIAAAWTMLPRDSRARDPLRAAAIVAAIAVAPDVDLVSAVHRGPTHSIGMAILAGLAVFAATRSARWGLAAVLAWSSHVLLDWLSVDTRPPSGLMALWPISRDYFASTLQIFPAVSRRFWRPEFWIYNLKALIVEVGVLGPLAWGVLVVSRRVERKL